MKADWVVVGGRPGESSHCRRCGNGLTIGTQRVEVATAAMKAFVKIHAACRPGTYKETPAATPHQWLTGRDTGTSSLTIFSAMTGLPSPHGDYDVPYDPDDFGRCYRLLRLFPEWREHLNKTVSLCPAWAAFVDNWDELTRIYEQELPAGRMPKLYARLQELQPSESETD